MKSAPWCAILVAVLLAGCASKERNLALTAETFQPEQDYRPWSRDGEALPDRHVILTFSGGGTRAAALAQGVLRELAATTFTDAGGRQRRLTDEVDLVSSVSGGSVTAANFALHGAAGFDAFERGFLRHNGMREIVLGVLNPVNEAEYILLGGQRTDLLVDMLDREVLHGARFADLLAAGNRDRRPYLVLNAADMSSGLRFPFTQSQFDLLCSDLSKLRLADAVAASAAFPVGMTPIMLRNFTPECRGRSSPAWTDRVSRVALDTGDALHTKGFGGDGVRRQPEDALFVGMDGTELTRRGPALRQKDLLDPAGGKRYVHLLDGGIADNLGLGEPLEMLSAAGKDGFGGRINSGGKDHIRELVFIVVNSRSQAYSDRDRYTATPGIFSMLMASIDAAVDGRTGGLQAQLNMLPQIARDYSVSRCVADATNKGTAVCTLKTEQRLKVTLVTVDFDLIRDDRCRQEFQSIGTNWNLEDTVVDSLLDMGSALLRSSAQYQGLVGQLNGRAPEGTSGAGPWPGQTLAGQACKRLKDWADAQKASAS